MTTTPPRQSPRQSMMRKATTALKGRGSLGSNEDRNEVKRAEMDVALSEFMENTLRVALHDLRKHVAEDMRTILSGSSSNSKSQTHYFDQLESDGVGPSMRRVQSVRSEAGRAKRNDDAPLVFGRFLRTNKNKEGLELHAATASAKQAKLEKEALHVQRCTTRSALHDQGASSSSEYLLLSGRSDSRELRMPMALDAQESKLDVPGSASAQFGTASVQSNLSYLRLSHSPRARSATQDGSVDFSEGTIARVPKSKHTMSFPASPRPLNCEVDLDDVDGPLGSYKLIPMMSELIEAEEDEFDSIKRGRSNHGERPSRKKTFFNDDLTIPELEAATGVQLSKVQSWAIELVQSYRFEQWSGFLVILNAVVLGIETDYQASHAEVKVTGLAGVLDNPSAMTASAMTAMKHPYDVGGLKADTVYINFFEALFCILFSAELAVRLFAYRCHFFIADSWGWNVFDCVVVGLMNMEQLVRVLVFMDAGSTNTSFMRLLWLLRLFRITRLIRIIRFVEELSTIWGSIMGSMNSLFWMLLLLIMVIYIVSVFFTMVVLEMTNLELEHHKELQYWYGRLPRTILTMFEVIVGGVSWDEALSPLLQDVSPWIGIIFCMYITFCVFVMMNMATGVFVERATKRAQEDRETYTANHISDLFFKEHHEGCVTWDLFNSKMGTVDMQNYFKDIDVDPSEARSLFELLDTDGSGSVDPEELVNGCLRLRGGAKALELSLLMHETTRMHAKMASQQEVMEEMLGEVVKATHHLARSCKKGDASDSPEMPAAAPPSQPIEYQRMASVGSFDLEASGSSHRSVSWAAFGQSSDDIG